MLLLILYFTCAVACIRSRPEVPSIARTPETSMPEEPLPTNFPNIPNDQPKIPLPTALPHQPDAPEEPNTGFPFQLNTNPPSVPSTTHFYSGANCIPKFGSCPPTIINPTNKTCNSHYDCDGIRLCCSTGQELRCSDPLESKSGQCPAKEKIQYGRRCFLDSHCPGSEKCCLKSNCQTFCTASPQSNDGITFRQSVCNYFIPRNAQCPSFTTTMTPCITNRDCVREGNHRMCCKDITGNDYCTEPFTTRPGFCPVATEILVDGPVKRCYLDENCPYEEKCCASPVGCISLCVNVKSTDKECQTVKKIGKCPSSGALLNEGSETCQSHAQCPGNRLCCEKNFFTGEKRCSDPFSQVGGTCPNSEKVDDKHPPCLLDDDCPSDYKCCAKSKCSYYCTPLNTLKRNDSYDCHHSPASVRPVCPFYPKNPSRFCFTNSQCNGNQLCCYNVCSDPENPLMDECPNPISVQKTSRCSSNDQCPGNSKCCPDVNCDKFCYTQSRNFLG